ncbi:1-phosphofructokinase family hexose kinase [Micromonospora sp. DT81.3]|uniref:1-phosphofructokinase family hexose kinase n=1 Tax=Micromonospora sp. DT81.3 TaxID=3416523 RepID=UPI003CF64500
MATTMIPRIEDSGVRTRVVSLTPAPAVDRVYVVDGLKTGHVNRARHIEAHIAGNGVNLARDLSAAGNAVAAVLPLSLEDAGALVEDIDMFHVVPVPQSIRVNAVVIGADGVTTNINQAAHALSDIDWNGLHDAVGRAADQLRAEWVVVGGSLPPTSNGHGVDPSALLEIALRTDGRLCLDSPGSVVADWLRRGIPIDLISPNIHELEELVERSIDTLGDAVDAASRLVDHGLRAVLVSLGRQGAVIVTPTRQIWARTSPSRVVNTTGAGDAALAGLITLWRGEDEQQALEHALTRAVRWGRAAVGLISPTIVPENIEPARVQLEVPPRSMPLHHDTFPLAKRE